MDQHRRYLTLNRCRRGQRPVGHSSDCWHYDFPPRGVCQIIYHDHLIYRGVDAMRSGCGSRNMIPYRIGSRFCHNTYDMFKGGDFFTLHKPIFGGGVGRHFGADPSHLFLARVKTFPYSASSASARWNVAPNMACPSIYTASAVDG